MKLTKKNAATVMGNINKFFKKDTKMYVGKVPDLVSYHLGVENIKKTNPDGSYFMECEKEYAVIVGKCNFVNVDDEYCLCINDKYSDLSIPLKVGFDITTKGNVMIIKENDVITGKDSLQIKNKSTYLYFYHMPVVEEEKREKVRHSIICMLDYLNRFTPTDGDEFDAVSEIYSKLMNAVKQIDTTKKEALMNVDFYNSHITSEHSSEGTPLYISDSTFNKSRSNDKVSLYVDIDKLYQNGLDYNDQTCYYLIYHGRTYNDIYSIVTIDDFDL